MTWKAKKKSRKVSKYKNNKSPKKKKKVINTESNVTLKLIYKCFVVGNNQVQSVIEAHKFLLLRAFT